MEQQKYNDRRRAAYNSGLAKVAVQCSADTFVVNQSLVLRINICGEIRHLRQAFSVSSKASGTGSETKLRPNKQIPFRLRVLTEKWRIKQRRTAAFPKQRMQKMTSFTLNTTT
jgi:hypothetical protein